MHDNNDKDSGASSGAGSAAKSGLSVLLKILIPVIIVVVIIILVMRLMKRGLGLGKTPEAQLKMAEVREGRSISRAEKREDRQDRKDMRLSIKALKKERRACKKATRGIKRRGGKRKRAKAECQKQFAAGVAALRADFKDQESASDARLSGAFSGNSAMGADGDD
jgi:hypothetical protein